MEENTQQHIDVFEALVSHYQEEIERLRPLALAEAIRRSGLREEEGSAPPAAEPVAREIRSLDDLPYLFTVRRPRPGGGYTERQARKLSDGSLVLDKCACYPPGEERQRIPAEHVEGFLSVYVPEVKGWAR